MLATILPGTAVTIYEMISLPPSDAGLTHSTSTLLSPLETTTPVGFPGAVDGVSSTSDEAAPPPAELKALIENVYFFPFIRPLTTELVLMARTLSTLPPGKVVISYRSIAPPPSDAGTRQDNSTDLSFDLVMTPSAAVGTPTGMTEDEDLDGSLVPLPLTAVTVNE